MIVNIVGLVALGMLFTLVIVIFRGFENLSRDIERLANNCLSQDL